MSSKKSTTLTSNDPLALPRFCNEGGVENDITFDHTLYTEADPQSFGGVDVFLNQFEC